MRSFKCGFCARPQSSRDARKKFCSKQCADRSRNIHEGGPVNDLRIFSRLSRDEQTTILLGKDERFKVAMFDIEATNLNANIGRILCCSFKPLGEDVYTFHGHEKRFMEVDNNDDGALAIAINNELETYDIIVGWNSKQFDIKFVNARAVAAGGQTKEKQYHVDGMWAYRSKMRAWSGLASVQQFLDGNGPQKTTIDWRRWVQALGWDKELREAAMKEITHHCELDVEVLERVYIKLVKANVIRSIRMDGGIL
jgi:uncharacterized protein YprB with RNaseH-like and TPR domain